MFCLSPLIYLIIRTLSGNLSANPIEDLTHSSGWWALTTLVITLVVTPLKIIFKKPQILFFRRTLGLFSFFYASIHFVTWIALEQFFDWEAMVLDVLDRPFITLGVIAFVLMIPLAATSPYQIRKKIGNNVWKKIHRLIYFAVLIAVLHFLWLVKKDLTEPFIFLFIVLMLLGFRVFMWCTKFFPKDQ